MIRLTTDERLPLWYQCKRLFIYYLIRLKFNWQKVYTPLTNKVRFTNLFSKSILKFVNINF